MLWLPGRCGALCNNVSRDIVHYLNRSEIVTCKVSAHYVIYSGNGSIFKSLNLIEFIWLEGKPCPPATFSHTNPLNISEIWTATKFYIPMLQTSNLAVSTYFFLLFPFLVVTKSQVLNVRMGRSRNPLLQKAYLGGDILITIAFLCVWSWRCKSAHFLSDKNRSICE